MIKKWFLSRSILVGTSLIPPIFLSYYQRMRSYQEFNTAQRRLQEHIKLHLACGNHILPGWANVDCISRKGVIRFDLTRPLPVASDTIQFIFAEHFIEHLSREQGQAFLSECQRVLIPGGVMRLSTPDLKILINAYLTEDLTIWSDVGFSPPNPCQMINDGMRLWGHAYLYDEQELVRTLKTCGFETVNRRSAHVSSHPELAHLECRPYHGELIYEATKSFASENHV